ncbi:MAG: glycogen debranching protein [Thermoanaerobaculia bacterium]
MAVLLALTARTGRRSAAAFLSGWVALTGCTERPAPADDERVLYRSGAFTIMASAVRQGDFEAVAVTRDRIESNYQRAATEVNFKFSINGEENEHPPGTDHMIYLKPRDGRIVTPVYTFGELQPPTTPEPLLAADTPEQGPVEVTFRLDMRHVLEAWRTAGVYDPPNGPPIAADAFEGVYVIGNVAPLSWNFGALEPGARVQLHDPDSDGIYAVTLPFEAAFVRPQTPDGRVVWTRRRDLSRFPAYRSPQILVDALHRLALEELLELRRDDGTLDAGGRWPGVWTRDLAWSTLLALALVAPEEVRNGLLARVDGDGRIIQDSGTGGSWPISTDRVAWAPAALELYAATGDREWLRTAYDVIRRSAEADLEVAFDPATGLFRGESSFLDWREQSYPGWMDAKDIGASQALGTNVLHYATYRVLARMARLLGEPHERWEEIAGAVRRGLNTHLWQPDRGIYGAYRYGRLFPSVAPHPEMLGEALAVVLGAADGERSRQIASHTPVVPFGVPSFWPYIPDVPPYHNVGVWPQVVGFRAWAAAEAGNQAAVEHALASLYRAAGLFLTNKENWVAATGHFEGTEVNSDRFQASAAAQLATVYRVLFGIRLHEDRMELRPFVPKPYDGTRTLTNLRYRDARLTITVHGFGDTPRAIQFDGRPIPRAEIPADLTGAHTLEITLNDSLASPPRSVRFVDNSYAPPAPQVELVDGGILWHPVNDALRYVVYRNGRRLGVTEATDFRATEADGVAEYQVQAVDQRGLASFLSEPLPLGPAAATRLIEPAPHLLESTEGGYEGAGYARFTAERLISLDLPVSVTVAGPYAIDVRYANGSGPISYGDKAAVRTLLVDGETVGCLLLPQRGAARWDDWGYSNALRVRLAPGPHVLTLAYRAADRNMHGTVNEALLDHVRVTRLAEP